MRILIFVFVLLFSSQAKAEKPLKELSYFEVMQRSVSVAAKSDAYGDYCARPSQMAQTLTALFLKKEKIDAEQAKVFKALGEKTYQETKATLEAQALDCGMIDVTMQRYEIMRELKNLSYMLNGVKAQDIPADPPIPSMETMVGGAPIQ